MLDVDGSDSRKSKKRAASAALFFLFGVVLLTFGKIARGTVLSIENVAFNTAISYNNVRLVAEADQFDY